MSYRSKGRSKFIRDGETYGIAAKAAPTFFMRDWVDKCKFCREPKFQEVATKVAPTFGEVEAKRKGFR